MSVYVCLLTIAMLGYLLYNHLQLITKNKNHKEG